MGAQRMTRALSLLGALALLLTSSACAPEIPNGHFACTEVSDCPDEFFCWSNGRCYDTPEFSGGDAAVGRDAEPQDVQAFDLGPDARFDTGVPRDAGPREDAAVEDGATDGAVPDAGCDPNFGDSCNAPGRCGAVIDCSGACVGGEPEPVCSCEPSVCQTDGTWSACEEPVDLGQSCTSPGTCGATIDCMGGCSGGAPPPACACGAPVCAQAGVWTCPGPSNYGQNCDGPSTCGGTIDCNGNCAGGRPLPTCQCGTATCGGCVGGTCGTNSQCVSGACVCTVSNCSCPVGGAVTCQVCRVTGDIGTCITDTYGCGDFSGPDQTCAYGCTANDPPVCACHPQEGQTCGTETCSCWCGGFQNVGSTQCDGSCSPFYPNCGSLCQDYCGPFCPLPPCIDPN